MGFFRPSKAQRRGRTEEWEPRQKRVTRALERRKAKRDVAVRKLLGR